MTPAESAKMPSPVEEGLSAGLHGRLAGVAGSTRGQLPRWRALVLLRATSAIATACLVVVESGFKALSPVLVVLLIGALLSNVGIASVARRHAESRWFTGSLVVLDTCWITAVLLLSGHVESNFFYAYFFVLFLAGITESLGLVAIGTIVVSVAYLLAASAATPHFALLRTDALIRIPFFLAIATFYSYLLDRVRTERQAALVASASAGQLRAAQEQLEIHARRVERVNVDLQREVDARRAIEAELKSVNEELRRCNEAKSAFVSMVAHEIKNPLACLSSSMGVLASGRAGTLDETQRRFLTMAQRNTARLARLVGDLLDLARIEAGVVEYVLAPLHVAPVLADLAHSHRVEAEARSLSLDLRLDPTLPPVWADAQRLEQIVSNLLSNAMKFTPSGGSIIIEAKADAGFVEVAVVDTGVGLTEEDQARVFERFYQVRDGATRRLGTGLGLSIAHHLAKCHGSDIRIESRLGEGSRFSFRLGVEAPDARRVREADEMPIGAEC